MRKNETSTVITLSDVEEHLERMRELFIQVPDLSLEKTIDEYIDRCDAFVNWAELNRSVLLAQLQQYLDIWEM